MKTFISLAVACSLMSFTNPGIAASQGEGIVTLGGQVMDSACGLELASRDQTIEMPAEPVGRLLRNTQGNPHPFELRLINCSLSRPDPFRPGASLPDWEHLRVMFDGASDMGGRSFALFGESQGVALDITDADGHGSVPGEALPRKPLVEGDMTLHFTLRLVGNGRPIVVGPHRAAVRFKLEYF